MPSRLTEAELAPPKKKYTLPPPEDPALKRQRECRQRIALDLGKRYSVSRSALTQFSIYDKRQSDVLAKLKDYAQDLEKNIAAGRSILLYGPVGTGKDHLLAWLLHWAAEIGKTCRWFSGQEFYATFRDMMDRQPPYNNTEAMLIAPYSHCDVLGISDPTPPEGEATNWNRMQLYRLIDIRYRNGRPVWMTMNAGDQEEAERRLTSPIFDRLQDDAVVLECFWSSYRERSK